MNEKELKSLVQQVLYCYGLNRSARKPVRLVLSGMAPGSDTAERLQKMSGYEGWLVEKLEGQYIDRFKQSDLVYLTADADEVLHNFESDKVYVIGGIVDRNRLKGATLNKAKSQGIASAQLPLGEYIEMGAFSRVLAVNHVFQMTVEHQLTKDWRQVFEKCVPGRKQFLQPGGGGPDVEAAGASAEHAPSVVDAERTAEAAV